MGTNRKSDRTLERGLEALESLTKMLKDPTALDPPKEVDGAEDSLELFGFPAIRKNETLGGVQYLFYFPNLYGASVIQHPGSYGYENGLWELAVIRYSEISPDHTADKWRLCYTTPITDDVLGRLTETKVKSVLAQIKELPTEG